MNIPKSLHTVTALVAVARATQKECVARGAFFSATVMAAEILGYHADDIDSHNLLARAADTLKKAAA